MCCDVVHCKALYCCERIMATVEDLTLLRTASVCDLVF